MMKTRIAVMALAVSFMAAGACFAANPHLGAWKLNEAKSKLAPGMGKSTMVNYTEQKDKIKVTVDGVDKDGKPTHGVWVGKFDGKAYPAKGNMSWNSAAYKEVNERTNDITTWKDGKMVWSGRIPWRQMANRALSRLTGQTRRGKSSAASPFTIRRR